MAIFSISHSNDGRKQLSLKSPVDLSHIGTYDCANKDEISKIMNILSDYKKHSMKVLPYNSAGKSDDFKKIFEGKTFCGLK